MEKKAYSTVYADLSGGQAVTFSSGRTYALPAAYGPGCSLPELVAVVLKGERQNTRIFLCGELPGNYEAWLFDLDMMGKYTTGNRGHHRDEKEDTGHVARYQHRATGINVEIRTMHAWMGDAPCAASEAIAAISLLNQYLAKAFYLEAKAYATPALTFQTLWTTMNRLEGKKIPILSEGLRNIIRGSSGQGRVELCTPDRLDKIPGLHYYDGIFMYAALSWGMPTDIAAHDNQNIYEGKQPGRYHIRYTVPDDWHHIGIFMTPREQITGRLEDDEAWAYPGEKECGRTFETWADGAEIDVLVDFYSPKFPPGAELSTQGKERAYQLGMRSAFRAWKIEILERIIFKNEKDSEHKKPLASVIDRLVKMRARLEQDAAVAGSDRQRIYKLVRGMIRNIVLHGIGSFHRTDRPMTFIRRADEAPEGADSARPLGDGLYLFSVAGKTDAYMQQLEHPEWAQLIWARCRARMTRAALALPREQIIAIRTDAIATTTEQHQWEDNTKNGTLRPKWHINRPIKAPHSLPELDALVHRHVKEDR